ncbi:hypothetical protein CLV71_126115 [Actinophytocola oryzae]|uniref:Uncharacterized protein n=1 Tax=Actinophytocola oryzae TaxID=502181 RepID=A0A4V3FQG0_9PSEU|nr:hypothetical protein CLV71_126115 [Actinophytocola oryzae]
MAGEHLSTFLDQLAADFAGWENVRTWQTWSRDLSVEQYTPKAATRI